MNQSTLLIYVGTLWRDAENGSDGPIPEPYCIPDEEDVDFPWLDMYDDVRDTQEEPK